MEKEIFTFSIKQSNYASVKIQANSFDEALKHLKEDPYWMESLIWQTDSFSEIEITDTGTYTDDGEFDIDLSDTSESVAGYGNLVIKKLPEGSNIKVTDSTGASFQFKLNDEEMIAAGKCSWEVFSDGISLGKGSYEIYPGETNPLFVNI
jgi:hypothetical protein